MLEVQKEVNKDFNFCETKDDYFEKIEPKSKEYLEILSSQEFMKLKKSFSLVSRIGLLGTIVGAALLMMKQYFGLLHFAGIIILPVFSFLFFMPKVVMLFVPDIKNDFDSSFVPFEKNEQCRACSKVPGMENVALYMDKVDKIGRRLTNQEYHLVMNRWRDTVRMKKKLNFSYTE